MGNARLRGKVTGIIFVNYDRKDISLRSLNSLINTTNGQDARIVVVDNGSRTSENSSTKEIVDLLKEKKIYSLISFDRNMGLGYARNIGIKILKESCNWCGIKEPEYYLFSDNDFLFREGWLKIGTDFYERNFNEYKILAFYIDAFHERTKKLDNMMEHECFVSETAPGGCYIMKREIVDAIGTIPTNMGDGIVCCGNEDWHIINFMKKNNYKYVSIDGLVRNIGIGHTLWRGDEMHDNVVREKMLDLKYGVING